MHRIQKASLLFLDESAIRLLLQFDAEGFPVVSRVLDAAYENHIQMIVSPMTLYSVAKLAYSKKNAMLARQYREFFTRSVGLSMREIDPEALLFAADFSARFSLTSEESFQLAAAYASGADVVLTTRASWVDYLEAEVVTVDSLKV